MAPASDADLQQLRGINNLGTLDLGNTQVTDAGIKHLSGLSDLETLTLEGTE